VKRFIIAQVLVLAFVHGAAAQEGARQLTLKEAIKLAVEKNLDVQAELYNPASAVADIKKNQGIYNPLLSLGVNYQDSNTEATIPLTTGGESIDRQRSTGFTAGLNQLVSTGGTVGAAFNNSWNHNNFGLGSLNNYFQSDIKLSFTQPLLKNFGKETTELTIDVARFNKEGALEQFQAKLLSIISQVKTQYYQLYFLRENLEVKKTSLSLAETILTNSRAQVKAGVLPAYEVLNAEFGVATQQKNVIDAERALSDQVDLLRVLIQLNGVTDIIPVDAPFRDPFQIDEPGAIQRAIAGRPDLKQQRFALQASELQSRVARSQTQPELDFTTSADFTGLGSTYNQNLDRVGSGQFPAWNIGLQLTYPIGNDAARNDYIKSKLKVDQTKTQIRSLEESVANDVRTAVRAVRSGYKQLDVTARGRAYADQVLQAYIKKQKVGLATTKDVLDELNNQVTAKGNEIQAVSDYNKAIVTLWAATGELLEREGITLNGKEANELYEKNR
jgi:outer membrane protein